MVGDTTNIDDATLCDGELNPWKGRDVTLICNTVGRYVWVYLPDKRQVLELHEVKAFVDRSCETRQPDNARMEGTCTGAEDGDTCTTTCTTGFAKSSGDETAVCRFGEWSAPEIVCTAQCPAVPAPTGAESCKQVVASENFANTGRAARRFASIDESEYPLSEFWGFADSRLVSAPPPVDGVLGTCLKPGQGITALLQDPDPRSIDSAMAVQISLNGEDDAGLVFRAVGANTYYYVSLGFGTGIHRLVRRIAGKDVELGISGVPLRSLDASVPGDKHDLRVSLDGPSIMITVDGSRLIDVEDVSLLAGDVGVWAEGRAEFDDLHVETSCLTGGGPSISGCRDLFD